MMSVGPLGGVHVSAAGAPYAQTKGPDVERTEQESAAQQRHTTSDRLAESAAGIGETGKDSEASDRDADGRRLWEEQLGKAPSDGLAPTEHPEVQSKDATGDSGNQLDLSG